MTQLTERLSNRAPLDLSKLDEQTLMGVIDHSLLRPELTPADVEAGLEVALEWQTATVCCRPADLPLTVARLRGSLVGPTTVIGFPHGAHLTEIKKREAQIAVEQGAVELDVVFNIGLMRAGEYGKVRDELGEVIWAVAPTPVKVIIESAYLTPEQVAEACHIVAEVRGAFVKNGTGYSPRGATPDEIRLMRRETPEGIGVKAAGGVRTLDQALAVLAAGANRIGATATPTIAKEWRERGPEALASIGKTEVATGAGEY